jgi:hypothetical protein
MASRASLRQSTRKSSSRPAIPPVQRNRTSDADAPAVVPEWHSFAPSCSTGRWFRPADPQPARTEANTIDDAAVDHTRLGFTSLELTALIEVRLIGEH